MAAGKTVRIKVKTINAIYEGDFVIPVMRNRVSDVLNDEERQFINLTNVEIKENHGSAMHKKVPFVSLNKALIEAIFEET